MMRQSQKMSNNDLKRIIQSVISTNDNAVINTLMIIYRNQTSDEQTSGTTHEHNKIGFTSFDAKLMSSFVYQYLEHSNLSKKQMRIARGRAMKYWKQVYRYYNGNMKRFTEPYDKEYELEVEGPKLLWVCICGKIKVYTLPDGEYPEGVWCCSECKAEWEWGT